MEQRRCYSIIKSGKIFLKSISIIAVFLLVFCNTTTISFANEVLTTPESTSTSIISTETTSEENHIDVQEMLFLPLYTESLFPSQLALDSSNSNINSKAIVGPVWVTKSFNVTKNGRTVTAEWTISTDTIIREVNASFNTGAGWTDTTSFKGPNAGGVTLTQTWTYSKDGTYTVGGVAQILTDKGYASCFSPPRVVLIN